VRLPAQNLCEVHTGISRVYSSHFTLVVIKENFIIKIDDKEITIFLCSCFPHHESSSKARDENCRFISLYAILNQNFNLERKGNKIPMLAEITFFFFHLFVILLG
jgi:hypothetical protein